MTKIFVTGANGQLGFDVCRLAEAQGIAAVGSDIDKLDLTDKDAVVAALNCEKPSVVVHCAAYTAVDKAETEPETAMRVNRDATRHIAEWCGQNKAWLIYISTDYVFDGSGEMPREPDETPNPLSVYGKTKYAGEQMTEAFAPNHLIVRTSWVFGRHGANFAKTMLRLGAEQAVVRVVNDQFGAPTFTEDLAVLLLEMALRPCRGVYHAANSGVCSWADFARAILRQAKLPAQVEGVSTAAYFAAAKNPHAERPLNSRFSPRALLQSGYSPLPPWEDALSRFLFGESVS
jgi:dTDP-4-dehydrorhamnose reductase